MKGKWRKNGGQNEGQNGGVIGGIETEWRENGGKNGRKSGGENGRKNGRKNGGKCCYWRHSKWKLTGKSAIFALLLIHFSDFVYSESSNIFISANLEINLAIFPNLKAVNRSRLILLWGGEQSIRLIILHTSLSSSSSRENWSRCYRWVTLELHSELKRYQ